MDARTLYQEGVKAIREQDTGRGRKLLLRSLAQNPDNDMAWLWLTHTVNEPEKRLEYVERALQINPQNENARAFKDRLQATLPSPTVQPAAQPVTPQRDVIQPLKPKTVSEPLTKQEEKRVTYLMEQADRLLEEGDTEGAIAQWINVLKIRVDHPLALKNAAGHLWRLNYREDVHELVQRALDAGTQVPSIYITAIDIAEREQTYDKAEALREQIATLPNADQQLIVTVADHYVQRHQIDRALSLLEQALEANPDGQQILIKLGDLNQELGRSQQATAYYDRAVRLGTRTRAGKEADRRLSSYVPVLTDRERGSVWLALRETAGIGIFYLLMGWQDAGLNLLEMGPRRWIGVTLSLIGGYLLVTATSSPQQRPLAGWLGGSVPPEPEDTGATKLYEDTPQPQARPGSALQEPTALPIIPPVIRYALGVAGILLLMLAFGLVMYHAINLVTDNPPPLLPWHDNPNWRG